MIKPALEKLEQDACEALNDLFYQNGEVRPDDIVRTAGVYADVSPKEGASLAVETPEWLGIPITIELYYLDARQISCIDLIRSVLTEHLLDILSSHYSSLLEMKAEAERESKV